jgi:hypothetical protein
MSQEDSFIIWRNVMKKLLFLLLLSGCFKDGGHLLQTAEYYQCPDNLMQDVRSYLEEAKKCQAQ